MCKHEVSAFVVLSAAFENPKIARALDAMGGSETGPVDDTVDFFLQLSGWKRGRQRDAEWRRKQAG